MPNISIKNVPEGVLELLRRRARRNHRSLQGELMALICAAAANGEGIAPTRQPQPRLRGKTVDEIVSEQDQRWKQPFQQTPLAVDMVREDRDAR